MLQTGGVTALRGTLLASRRVADAAAAGYWEAKDDRDDDPEFIVHVVWQVVGVSVETVRVVRSLPPGFG